QHIAEVIMPALAQDKIVLCDRFNDSSIAYQGAGRKLGIELVRQICELVCEGFQPILSFYLDVDPYIGLTRTQQAHKENAAQGQMDRIEAEKMDFHFRVRQGFLAIAKEYSQRFHVLDANQSANTVYLQAIKILETIL